VASEWSAFWIERASVYGFYTAILGILKVLFDPTYFKIQYQRNRSINIL